MRIIRVRYQNRVFYAALQETAVVCLNPQLGFVDPIPLEEVVVLPVVAPSKIICAGLNYKAHAAEFGLPVPDHPIFFLKPPSSIIGAGQSIRLPTTSSRVEYEAELGLVIGRETKHVKPEQVADHLFGYTCANDVTARDLQKNGDMFGRSKGFDTFCPVGPWIESEVDNPDSLAIRLFKNDEVMQESNTSEMLFHPFELVSFIAQSMTLLPGDLILTGTPAGVGPMLPGDELRVEIDGVGVLINPVTDTLGRGNENDAPMQ